MFKNVESWTRDVVVRAVKVFLCLVGAVFDTDMYEEGVLSTKRIIKTLAMSTIEGRLVKTRWYGNGRSWPSAYITYINHGSWPRGRFWPSRSRIRLFSNEAVLELSPILYTYIRSYRAMA